MEIDFGNITHLFIDLDGTLVNSLPKLKYVYDDFLSEHQKSGSVEEFSTLKTSSIEKLIEFFKMKYVLNPPSAKLKEQYESYLEKHYFKAPLFYGVKAFLEKAKKRGLKLILTTANQKKFAEKVLQMHQIEGYFAQIITPICFKLQKKEACFYQKILNNLNLSPSQVLVIDDSLEVIASATQMGLKAFLFSKINYHPLPCFGSWKLLTREWFTYARS